MLNGVFRVSENRVSELAKCICTGLGYRKKAATKIRMAVNIAVTRTFNLLFGSGTDFRVIGSASGISRPVK